MFELPTGAQLSQALSTAAPLLLTMGENLQTPPGQRDPNSSAKGMALMLQQGEMQRKARQEQAMRDFLASAGGQGGQPAPGAPGAAPGAQPAAGGQPPTSLASMITPEMAQMFSVMPPEMAMQTLAQMMTRPEARGTSAMQEYEFARSQGFNGTLLDFVNSRAAASRPVTTVTNRIDARSEAPVPTGYQAVRDANGQLIRYDPVPGGPADREIAEAERARLDALAAEARAAEAAQGQASTASDIITSAAQRARDAAAGVTFPSATTATAAIPLLGGRTDSAEVVRQTAVLQAQAKMENLQAMRRASPTGGALGAVSDSEQAMLAQKSGALDPDSPNFARDLDDYERSLLRTIHGREEGDRIFAQTRSGTPAPAASPGRGGNRTPAPQGIPAAPSWYDPGPANVPWEEAWEFLPEATRQQMMGAR